VKKLNLTATINLKANASGRPRRFSILAYSGGPLIVGGFKYPVICDLTAMEWEKDIPILIDHQNTVSTTLGITDSIDNDGSRVVLAGPVTGASPLALQVIAQSDAGHGWEASIGATVLASEDFEIGQSVVVNGREWPGPVTVSRHTLLRETSVLAMGADATTSVNLAAKAALLLKGAAMLHLKSGSQVWGSSILPQ